MELGNVRLYVEANKELFGERRKVLATWEGPPIAEVGWWRTMSVEPSKTQPFNLGSFRVKYVADGHGDTIIVRRGTGIGRVYEAIYKIDHWLMYHFLWRVILTLSIWGLANKPRETEYIGWHLVKDKWFKRK